MSAFRLLSVVVFLALAHTSYAQNLQYGGKAGVNWASITFDQDEDLTVTGKPGIVAGGFVTFSGNRRLGFQVEALYSRRVTEFENEITDTLAYAELPLLVRYRLMSNPRWTLHVVGGAVLSFLQKATEEIGGVDFDIKNSVESTETAAAVGVDAQVWRNVVVGFRFIQGLSDLYTATDFPAKQRTIQITAGWRIK